MVITYFQLAAVLKGQWKLTTVEQTSAEFFLHLFLNWMPANINESIEFILH